MFIYRLAYRHTPSNLVEGFVGVGFTKKSAKENAINKIRSKCESIGHALEIANPYYPNRLIEHKAQLSDEEWRIVLNDWRIEK